MKTCMLTLLTFAAVPLGAQARLIGNWPYDKLMQESDLVVIAKVESVADFDGNVELALFAEYLTPQVTTFKVEGVLDPSMRSTGFASSAQSVKRASVQFTPSALPAIITFPYDCKRAIQA